MEKSYRVSIVAKRQRMVPIVLLALSLSDAYRFGLISTFLLWPTSLYTQKRWKSTPRQKRNRRERMSVFKSHRE
jgi:hypothetical protein